MQTHAFSFRILCKDQDDLEYLFDPLQRVRGSFLGQTRAEAAVFGTTYAEDFDVFETKSDGMFLTANFKYVESPRHK